MIDLFDALDNDPGGEPCSQAGESPATFDFNTGPEEKRGIQPVIAPVTASSGFKSRQAPPSAWREVPQALFLSWSEAQQLAYCAARDEDAALRATTMEETLWYQTRAKSYER